MEFIKQPLLTFSSMSVGEGGGKAGCREKANGLEFSKNRTKKKPLIKAASSFSA